MAATLLSGCDGVPLRLKNTADKEMFKLANWHPGYGFYAKPVLLDQKNIDDDNWCLAYELSERYSFASLWQKQDQNWVQMKLIPNKNSCDGVHY